MQKFIRRIEVGTESVRIHWIIDRDHFTHDPAVLLGASGSGLVFLKNVGSRSLTFGAQVEQVGEHRQQATALLIFVYNCYPEAKILSSLDLRALHQDLRSWHKVAELVGASEAFARQSAKNKKA